MGRKKKSISKELAKWHLGEVLGWVAYCRHSWIINYYTINTTFSLLDEGDLLPFENLILQGRNTSEDDILVNMERHMLPFRRGFLKVGDEVLDERADDFRSKQITINRAAVLTLTNFYLDYHEVDRIYGQYSYNKNLITFIHGVRNIIVHGGGFMNKVHFKEAAWRDITLRKGAGRLKMNDRDIYLLLSDLICDLANRFIQREGTLFPAHLIMCHDISRMVDIAEDQGMSKYLSPNLLEKVK